MADSRTLHAEPAGTPGVWSTALATAVVLAMLLALVWIVAVNAFGWFWPSRVVEVRIQDGETLIGEPADRRELPEEGTYQLKLKVGARDLDGRDFRWIDEDRIEGRTMPDDVVRIERREYGDVFGRIEGCTSVGGAEIAAADRETVLSVLEEGQALRGRLEDVTDRIAETREPLTDIEETLNVAERSDRAETTEGQEAIRRLESARRRAAERLRPELDALGARKLELEQTLERAALSVDTGRGRLRVPLGQVIEVTWPNEMSTPYRMWRALRRGVLFLFTEPREANTEGGIFPALFGTVLLVLIMSVAVVPLGVLAAVYMTEYAKQGILLRLATQAVHNLAGVPSIVFGMFGLGFFIYGVGGTLDRLFFADRLPTPTFGTGGILWAALTLALLTVPVVVVSTREGLLAVPKDWRDGSLALGATKWQTLKTVVLPASMPGILTGLILAIGRAAGEVAPLMLTGAVKMAPAMPVDGEPPFLHLDRKFMHLGFHIYDVSMQSPNVEAAKPMAFATTLVLLVLVVAMNLTAIIVRRRLQKAYRGGHV